MSPDETTAATTYSMGERTIGAETAPTSDDPEMKDLGEDAGMTAVGKEAGLRTF
ncbi:hypothetical protein GCM10010980_08960 [Corynebacterium marinum]|nr:hypothetical protein GCM10010980_08960 [Corynebacterium marinum]